MNNKLQELTEKIYLEGVEKGKVEAAQLIADAEHEAKAIIAKAQAEADKIKAEAANKNYDLVLAKSVVLVGGTDITEQIIKLVK